MEKIDLSVVIPCFNSEKNIEQVVKNIDSVFSNKNINYEIIAVNDFSNDNTIEILRKLANIYKNIIVINLAKKLWTARCFNGWISVYKRGLYCHL